MKTKKFWLVGVVGLILAAALAAEKGTSPISAVVSNDGQETTQGAISGHVYQVNGQPISGATVQVMRMDAEGLWEVTTESDGSYKVNGLPTGDYKVRSFKDGFAREYYDNVVFSLEATIIHVTASEEITGIDFTLTEGGAISGYVYDQRDGSPIEQAHVWVRPSKYFFDDGFDAFTDSNGIYIADGLSLGNYKVTVETSVYAMSRYYDQVYGWGNAADVKVNPPETTQDINIGLELAGSISGFILASDGITPIPNVGLIADPTSRGFEGIGSESREDGSYTIEGLPPVNYTVRTGDVMPNWYAGEFYDSKYTWETADKVPVTAGNDTDNINFTLDEGGWITGHVFDEETGEPISGAQLGASLIDGGQATPLPITQYDGSYRLVMREGIYVVGTGPPGYVFEWYNNCYEREKANAVSVTVHQENSGIDFYLAKGGSISGHVYSEEGNPIGDASVYAFSDIFPGSGANSQSNGSYIIEGLPSGSYTVQVTVTGYFSEYKHNVVVDAPDNTPGTDFTLKKITANFDVE